MADGERSLIRRIVTIFDRPSAKKAEEEQAASLGAAGAKGGANFVRELKAVFDKRQAELKVQLAKGLIDPATFRAQGNLAAKEFNTGILRGMEQARAAGQLTDAQFVKLSRTLKTMGSDGVSAWDRIKSGILRAGAALAGYFALSRLIGLGKESVAAAIAEKKAFDELAGTLATVGIAYADVEQEITNTQRALEKSTAITDDEVASVLQRLITITGNYKDSLAEVGLVANVAAAYHKTLDEAATLVGKVMVGNLRPLKQVGINAKDAADGIKQLTDNTVGAAEAALQPTERLSKQWGEFKEAFGNAILAVIGGDSTFEGLTNWIITITHWLEDNRKKFAQWGSFVIKTFVAVYDVLNLIPQTLDEITTILADVALGNFKEAHESWLRLKDDFVGAKDSALGAARALGIATGVVKDSTPPVVAHTAALHKRADATDRVTEADKKHNAELERAEKARLAEVARQEQIIGDLYRELEVTRRRTAAVYAGTKAVEALNRELFIEDAVLKANAESGSVLEAQVRALAAAQYDAARQLAEAEAPVPKEIQIGGDEKDNEEKARRFASPWVDALGMIRNEVLGSGHLLQELAEAWAQGGWKAVASLAKGKVKENLARVIEETAKGIGALFLNPAEAATHFKSAALHGAAAAAWKALAGGGGGGGGAGGAGGSGSGVPNSGGGPGRRTDALAPRGPEVSIYLTGPGFDALNPEVQRVVYGAQQAARERFGDDAKITVRRGR